MIQNFLIINGSFELKRLAYPYDYFISIDEHQKPVNNLQEEGFFGNLQNKGPDDEEIKRTKEGIKVFDIKNERELTQLYLKSVVLLFACVFEKFIKVSIHEFKNNPLFCVSLTGYTWQ